MENGGGLSPSSVKYRPSPSERPPVCIGLTIEMKRKAPEVRAWMVPNWTVDRARKDPKRPLVVSDVHGLDPLPAGAFNGLLRWTTLGFILQSVGFP